MPRLLLTLAVACSLSGLYCVYTALVKPLLALPEMTIVGPIGPINAPPRPVDNVNVARAHLSDQDWAANARYHLKSHDSYIFTNEWDPEGSTGRIRLTPFAMVWMTRNTKTGADEPVTVVSESAVVKFAGSFQFPNPEPGRLVHAILDGRAQILGPDGLVIDGKNFTFSEAANRLWSDYEVHYEYAGNRGSADILEIDLIPQSGEPGDDRPHVFGIRTVRLSRNVKMELQLKEREAALPLKIKCNGSFEFDLVEQQASYSDDVVAFRQTGPAAFDWIECDRLIVQFQSPHDGKIVRNAPEPGASDTYQQIDPRLKFHWLRAESVSTSEGEAPASLVHMFSTEHQLEARSSQLIYDGIERQIRLTHPEGVQVLRARHPVLLCPDVLLTLGDGQQLKSALCRGAGWMVHRDPQTNSVAFAVDWKSYLRHAHDPATGLDQVELQESASFRQPPQELALGADLIQVWLKPQVSRESAAKAEAHEVAVQLDRYDVERLEAHQKVVLVSPQLEANSEHLQVWLDHDAKVAPPTVDDHRNSSESRTESPAEPGKEILSRQQPIEAQADTIRVRLRPGTGTQPDVADVWTEGRVEMTQAREVGTPPMRVRGDRAHVENHGGLHQLLHLFGNMAEIRDGEVLLEAREMHLDRADNQFRVVGGGTLQLPVTSDLEGQALDVPEKLTLMWQERMSFDGILATFRGAAEAVLNDRRLKCETMEVTLTDRIRFDTPPKKTDAIELRGITCRDRVELKSQTYAANKLIEVQTANVSELRLDRVTGSMFAQGPGVMQMWRRGDGPRNGLRPQQSTSANHPVQLDTSEWQYTHVKFDGQMNGQLQHRHAVFRERVEITHGPVKLPNERLTREKLPKAGGFMSCRELQVKQVPGTDVERHLIQLAADGNAWLEGEGFAASADQIVYDEVRESYILRGQGRNNARVWHSVIPGVETTPSTFQRGEFFPATRQIRIDAVSTAEGSR